jgi:hypothetical protein
MAPAGAHQELDAVTPGVSSTASGPTNWTSSHAAWSAKLHAAPFWAGALPDYDRAPDGANKPTAHSRVIPRLTRLQTRALRRLLPAERQQDAAAGDQAYVLRPLRPDRRVDRASGQARRMGSTADAARVSGKGRSAPARSQGDVRTIASRGSMAGANVRWHRRSHSPLRKGSSVLVRAVDDGGTRGASVPSRRLIRDPLHRMNLVRRG